MTRIEIIRAIRSEGISYLALHRKTDTELKEMHDEFFLPKNKVEVNPYAFDEYKQSFRKDVEKYGFESTYLFWAAGSACGCMGPTNGEPLCPCAMRRKTAEMFGKVVPVE